MVSRRLAAGALSLGLLLSLTGCGEGSENGVSPSSKSIASESDSPETSAKITVDGWEPIPLSSTDYVGVILSLELGEGDGAGSRLIIQRGIPSSQSPETHADNLVFDLQNQGVEVKTYGGREISGEDAVGLSYRNTTTSRRIHTWYVVKDGLRYTINLESEEGARELGKDAEKVFDFIVLGE